MHLAVKMVPVLARTLTVRMVPTGRQLEEQEEMEAEGQQVVVVPAVELVLQVQMDLRPMAVTHRTCTTTTRLTRRTECTSHCVTM